MSDMKPRLVGGFGEINFGKQYRQGNRIYDADAIAVCLTAQPLGNMGGYSSLYVVRRKKSKKDGERINEKQSSWYGIFAGGVHLRYVLAHMDMSLDILQLRIFLLVEIIGENK